MAVCRAWWLLLGLLLVVGCERDVAAENVSPSTPAPGIPGAREPGRNLRIRLDAVTFLETVSDLDGTGEVFVEFAVFRQHGGSRTMRAPANDRTLQARAGERHWFNDYSLQVNNLRPSERVDIIFYALESDELGFFQQRSAEAAIDEALEALERRAASTSIGALLARSNGFGGFVVSILADTVLELWAAVDDIDYFVVSITPDVDDVHGLEYEALGDKGNAMFTYSLFHDSERVVEREVTRVIEVTRVVAEAGAEIEPDRSAAPTPTAVPQPLNTPAPNVTQFTIGRSADGRPIEVFRVGEGRRPVIFVSGLAAGYAPGTVAAAEAIANYLEANPRSVPDAVSVYIIPQASPDSARGDVESISGRLNGNGVDINRNWGCNWSPNAQWREYDINPGDAAFSEPETRALRDFFIDVDPEVVVFYSARGTIVSLGVCDGSSASAESWGRIYADASGYELRPITAFPVTGDASDWLVSRGIPAFFVLLPSYTSADRANTLDGALAIIEAVGR